MTTHLPTIGGIAFLPFQSAFFNSADVISIEIDGREILIHTRDRKTSKFKFNLAEVARYEASAFAKALDNSQSNNNNKHSEIMIKLSELAGQLESIEQKQDEADAEIRGRFDELAAEIAELKKQIGDDNLPPAAEAALGRVLAKAQALADIIPNPPPQPQ